MGKISAVLVILAVISTGCGTASEKDATRSVVRFVCAAARSTMIHGMLASR